MSETLANRIDYIRKRYRTINGIPVEDLPERQINAIYHSMVDRRKRPPKIETEHQISIWEI